MYRRVGERWRPDESIVEAWRRTVGPDVKYCFLQDIYDEEERTVTWDSTVEDDEKSRCGLDLEWEEPGGTIDLELGQLKRPFERNRKFSGPELGKIWICIDDLPRHRPMALYQKAGSNDHN